MSRFSSLVSDMEAKELLNHKRLSSFDLDRIFNDWWEDEVND